MQKRSLNWKASLLERSQQDPAWWIETVLGAHLWSKQKEICDAIVTHERVAVPASFGIGKTWLAARLTLWFLYNFRPAKIITTAPTNRQVKDLLWSELRTAHGKAKVPLGGEPLTLSLKIKDDQFAVGFSTEEGNMDMFTGYHAPNQMVVFDQAGGLPDMFWDAAEGLMTSENCRWLAISNTAISDCAFADICMPERKSRYGQWHIIPITAEESPNVVAGKNIFPGLVSYDWVERRRKAWGEDDPLYKIFVKAIFVPSVQMNVVPYKDLLRAYEYLGREDDAIEIGIDVARTGLDSTVMFARSGEKALEIKRLTGNDTMQVAGETIEFIRHLEQKYRKSVRVIKIDVIGIGAGVYDRLSEQDLPVLPINNAEVKIVVDRERFSNVRAEMAWAFRHRCEMGGVGLKNLDYEDSEIMNLLKGDLQIMKYKITSAGKIQIQLKEEIKKELGRSPDYWDACIMAFEEPGGGPAMVEFVSSSTGAIYEKAVSDDDWLTLLGQKIDLDHPSFYKMDL
jgi:phage terminase large subunit